MKIDVLIISLCLCFTGCYFHKVTYIIDDKYVGPCLILFVKNSPDRRFSYTAYTDNGIVKVPKEVANNPFVLRYSASDANIEIIPIGRTQSANDSSRYVFQLTNGYFERPECPGSIANISFFVGRKRDYIKWCTPYHDEFEYFKSKGIKWCD